MTEATQKPRLDHPVRIVPPAGFPVEWEEADDPDLLWSWDNFHTPVPSSPMSISVGYATRTGSEAATRAFGREPNRGRRQIINGYPYSARNPEPPHDDGEEHKRLIVEAIQSLEKRWLEEFLPELERDLEQLRSVDLESLSDGEYLDHLALVIAKQTRHWEIHFLVVSPVHTAVDRLKETYESLAGEGTGEDVYSLIDAADTRTMEVNRALDALGVKARELPEAASILRENLPADATLARLSESAEGRTWLADYTRFMDDYSYRPTGFDLRFKTWREDPSFVLVNVRGHLTGRMHPEQHGPFEIERTLVMTQVEAALEQRPELREEFESRLAQAREIWHLKEDHGFYIDQASFAIARITIAGLGRRLVRDGLLDDSEDVFYLELNEARDALRSSERKQAVVSERKRNIERWSKLSPPRYLGTVPVDDPPEEAVAQVLAAAASNGTGRLSGEGASAGSATGPARIVISPDEFEKVREGDVLVCRSTAPSWTPLFNIISGLISEAGGVLSHPAIIAREHGLPAVVGVPNATDLIADGQLVELDGESGAIRLLP